MSSAAHVVPVQVHQRQAARLVAGGDALVRVARQRAHAPLRLLNRLQGNQSMPTSSLQFGVMHIEGMAVMHDRCMHAMTHVTGS